LTAIRIVLADDFAPWRQIVRSILDGIPGVCVVAEASDGQEAAQKAETLLPDIVLLDISMPVLNGIEAVDQLHRSGCNSKIIFVTVHSDPDFVRSCLAVGAAGYVIKPRVATDLQPAISQVLAGHSFISPDVVEDNQSPLGN